MEPSDMKRFPNRYWPVYICVFTFLFSVNAVMAQELPTGQDDIQFLLERSQPLTLDLERQDSLKINSRKKKKKTKRRVFYGYKTKKGFTKSGFGDNTTVEIFYYLKKWVEPDPYVPEIYWFDFRRKKIRNTGTIDKKYGRILNGPYKKIQGDQILTEGAFYVGALNGRWVYTDRNDILVDKRKYYHGWPKESQVKYYDEERKKLKEVIPVVNGVVDGEYFYFFESGEIAVRGHYQNGEKVGRWTEYYENRRRSKKQIQYKADPYQEDFTPYTVKEWNESGKVIYDRETSRAN